MISFKKYLQIKVRETVGDIKNQQSRDIGNIRYIRLRTKTNKSKNTTHKTKKVHNMDPTKKKQG